MENVPKKQSVEIIFSTKNKKPVHTLTNYHEHLGFVLDSKVMFKNHINENIAKTGEGIGIIKYLSKYVPIKILDQIYKMILRPQLFATLLLI